MIRDGVCCSAQYARVNVILYNVVARLQPVITYCITNGVYNWILTPSRRQSTTTEEILIARGFRRQSTTEEMMRCRNFRRQSTQSEEMSKTRGRRDSCAQISDGTVATMTVETTAAFYDTSTQTGRPYEIVYLGGITRFLVAGQRSCVL